jgi:hypothetical protein
MLLLLLLLASYPPKSTMVDVEGGCGGMSDKDPDGLVDVKHCNSATTSKKVSFPEVARRSITLLSPPFTPINEENIKQSLAFLPSSRRSLSNKILIQSDETPARRLLLKMVDLQAELAAVNDRIMSGGAVSEEEWTSVRELIGMLGSTFHDDVDFAWENNIYLKDELRERRGRK